MVKSTSSFFFSFDEVVEFVAISDWVNEPASDAGREAADRREAEVAWEAA